MLNCKEGDIAMIVRSVAGNDGQIVRCIYFLGEVEPDIFIPEGPRWVIDPPVPNLVGGLIDHLADCQLKPIRGSDEEDEALRIVGRPVPMTAIEIPVMAPCRTPCCKIACREADACDCPLAK